MQIAKLRQLDSASNRTATGPRMLLYENFDTGVPVDPATAMAIAQAAAKVYAFFKDREEKDRLGKWLESIESKIDRLAIDLIELKRSLADLKVYLDEKQIQNAERDVLAAIASYVQLLPTIRKRFDDDALKGSLRADIYARLNFSVNVLKQYGFAVFATVGYAMKVELELLLILDMQESKRTVLDDYIRYYRRCLSKDDDSSIEQVRAVLKSTVDKLHRDYANGDSYTASFYFVTGSYEKCVSSNHGEHETCKTYHEYSKVVVQCVVKGSLEAGFSGTITDTGLVSRVSDNEALTYYVSPDRLGALSRATSFFDEGTIAEYNKQGKAYLALKEQLETVTAAIEACQNLEKVCLDRLQ